LNLFSKKLHTVSIIRRSFILLRRFYKSIVRCRIFFFLLLSFWTWCSRSFSWSCFRLRNSCRFTSICFSNKLWFFRYSSLSSPIFTATYFLFIFYLFHLFVLSCFIHSINIFICSIGHCRCSISISIFGHKFWSKCTFFYSIIFLHFLLLFDLVFFVFLPKFIPLKKVHLS